MRGDAYVAPNANIAPVAPTPAVAMDGDEPPGPDQQTNNYGIGHEINKGFHRIGGTLQQFFTGKRTVDKQFDNEQ